uniref:ATP-grasp domain-containing protein n=1 Tax=Lotharella globosa TaxID=91324 RepID=A0A7S3YYT8_9EUKA|mmetsp:Transcript_7205/g.14029  ORF Transcript_7205/g.14029 Transcript_7205/m.14029 type:complete len:460 (+) Transcript_7205:118-1497(+)|eukprot:CAMPEP_0167812660 /NCGR_PEP_ID=MMETSP0112_2-20121227/1384_1 /TAXON_ID=91324 /ORGANISM="Lotharella globosa, Strain CCCM811" /LENGTH=459 /DNA_ID=CAMNT_0007711581 /DNA_START=94 /DNA_END=1476 /DNA_ORIENTATION=-
MEDPDGVMQLLTSTHKRTRAFRRLRHYFVTRKADFWIRGTLGFILCCVLVTWANSFAKNAPRDFSAYLAKIKHTPALQTVRIFLGGYESYKSAKLYYKSQKPFLDASTKNTTLHRYWEETQLKVTGGETWQDMVVGRMNGMVKQLKDKGRDDYKVEKDKCEMYGHFARNDIPYVPLLGMWETEESLITYLKQLRSEVGKHTFPLWLKSCHLTQGDDAGRIKIGKSDLESDSKFNKIIDWVKTKWQQVPNDNARAWSNDAAVILEALTPRFLIQTSYAGPYGDSVGFTHRAPVELKVEVIWGRAYLANICDYEAYALRDGTIERWDTSLFSKIAHAPVTDPEQNKQVQWLLDEGHMEKVYALAEKVCRSMQADQVRVDIFVRPGDPDGLVVNEISISPGALYKWHAQFMATAWRQGHVDKSFHPTVYTKTVYETGPNEGVLSSGHEWFKKTSSAVKRVVA